MGTGFWSHLLEPFQHSWHPPCSPKVYPPRCSYIREPRDTQASLSFPCFKCGEKNNYWCQHSFSEAETSLDLLLGHCCDIDYGGRTEGQLVADIDCQAEWRLQSLKTSELHGSRPLQREVQVLVSSRILRPSITFSGFHLFFHFVSSVARILLRYHLLIALSTLPDNECFEGRACISFVGFSPFLSACLAHMRCAVNVGRMTGRLSEFLTLGSEEWSTSAIVCLLRTQL